MAGVVFAMEKCDSRLQKICGRLRVRWWLRVKRCVWNMPGRVIYGTMSKGRKFRAKNVSEEYALRKKGVAFWRFKRM